MSCGGVARNVAEGLARLGLKTGLVAVFGDDPDGFWLKQRTQWAGVDLALSLVIPRERTGSYTAVIDENGEMVVAVSDMSLSDGVQAGMLESRWPEIADSRLIFLDTNFSSESIALIARLSAREGKRLCVDAVSTLKASRLPEDLHGLFLLFCNRDEAGVLTGERIAGEKDARHAAQRLRDRGAQNVIITLGPQGMMLNADGTICVLEAPRVDVFDTTGAGDAMISGVLYGLIRGEPLEFSLRMGRAASAAALQSRQSVSVLINPDELYSDARKDIR